MTTSRIFAAASVALLAACHRGGPVDPANCDALAAKFVEFATADVHSSALSPADQTTSITQLGPLREIVKATCRDHVWPQKTRACMAAATSGTALAACAGDLSPAQRLPAELGSAQ